MSDENQRKLNLEIDLKVDSNRESELINDGSNYLHWRNKQLKNSIGVLKKILSEKDKLMIK